MDSRYICNHLRKLIRVMYITTGKGFYAREIQPNHFEFGCVEPPVKNVVHRSVAIYLICGNYENN